LSELRWLASAAWAEPIDFATGRINMKGVRLWAIGVGALAGAGLFTVERAYAGEDDHPTKCTLATLSGQYLFAGPDTLLFPPAFGVTTPSVSASAGYHIFNGDGTGTDFVTFTVNGINQNVPSPVATTYTLNPDCTGTFSVHNGPNFDKFVAVDGSALSQVATDPGASFSASNIQRVGSSRRTE
jgi:hypothetical protein